MLLVYPNKTSESTLNSGSGNILEIRLYTGTMQDNPSLSFTWNIRGHITTDIDIINVLYSGNGSGSGHNLTGAIASDGSISGTSESNCQIFFMPAGTAERFEDNHGQYVRLHDNKQEAAHTHLGMPEQSQSHEL